MQTGFLVNGSLLKSSIKRFWPLWLVDLCAWALLVVMPLYAAISAIGGEGLALSDTVQVQQSTWTALTFMTLPIVCVGAIIVAVCLNERLFSPQAATFYGQLPLGRDTLFATSFVAGILPQFAVEALVALFVLPLTAMAPGIDALMVGQWLAFALVVTLVMHAMAQAACQLAGNIPVAVFLYFLANFLVECLEVAVRLLASALLYGLSPREGLAFDWASPIVGLFHYGLVPEAYGSAYNWAVLAAYCVFALVALALAWFLNRRRDMERAGDAVAIDVLQPVLKYLAGICAALLVGAVAFLCLWVSGRGSALYLNTVEAVTLAVLMFAGAFLGVLFAQMAIARSSHVLGGCWKGGLILSAVVALSVMLCHADALGVARYVPEASDVERMEVLTDYQKAAELTSEEGIAQAQLLQSQALAYGQALSDGSASLTEWAKNDEEGYGVSTGTVGLVYQLKNGTIVERQYPVSFQLDKQGKPTDDLGSAVVKAAVELVNTDEAKRSRVQAVLDEPQKEIWVYYGEGVDDAARTLILGEDEAEDFMKNALAPDAESAAHNLNVFWGEEADESKTLDVSIDVLNANESSIFSYTLNSANTPRTVEWLKQHHPEVGLTPLA